MSIFYCIFTVFPPSRSAPYCSLACLHTRSSRNRRCVRRRLRRLLCHCDHHLPICAPVCYASARSPRALSPHSPPLPPPPPHRGTHRAPTPGSSRASARASSRRRTRRRRPARARTLQVEVEVRLRTARPHCSSSSSSSSSNCSASRARRSSGSRHRCGAGKSVLRRRWASTLRWQTVYTVLYCICSMFHNWVRCTCRVLVTVSYHLMIASNGAQHNRRPSRRQPATAARTRLPQRANRCPESFIPRRTSACVFLSAVFAVHKLYV